MREDQRYCRLDSTYAVFENKNLRKITEKWLSHLIFEIIFYYVDLEKRGGCVVVAREWHESRVSQWGELLAKAKQLKIFPLFKILTVDQSFKLP